MSSDPASPTDGPRRERLAALLARYHDLREAEPSVGIGVLREEAGDLFHELLAISDCEGLLHHAIEEEEPLPETFGPYAILERLGEGGSGVVYLARDPETDGLVALKVMRGTLAADAKALERFRREAQVAAELDHPAIVRIESHGEHQGRLYTVMEALAGPSLQSLLAEIQHRGGPTPDETWLDVLDASGVPPVEGRPAENLAETYARRIAGLMAPVARAIAAAGTAGLVHRDLKPGNLILDGDGNLKVTDFGLVKVFGRELTSTLAVMGTPLYLSPEQAGGGAVDHRSDVHALGVTLFESLTLALPFTGESVNETMGSILHRRAPRLRSRVPAYPRELEVLVERCLEKDPADRLPDAGALADDLARFARGGVIETRPVSRLRRLRGRVAKHRIATGALAAASVLVVAMVWLLFLRSGTLDVRSYPEALVWLDGERTTTTPYREDLRPGRYEVRLEREGFRTLARSVEVSSGDTEPVVEILEAVDSMDRAATAALAEAVGLPVPEPLGEPARTRAPIDVPVDRWWESITVLAPAGKVFRCRTVHLAADLSLRDMSVAIESADGLLWEAPIPREPDHLDWSRVVPDEVVARLTPGEYRLVLSRPGDPRRPRVPFTLVDRPERPDPMDALPAGAWERPEFSILRAERFLAEGFHAAAYRVASAVNLGHRRRALRVQLEALVRLDGRNVDRPFYATVLDLWESAR